MPRAVRTIPREDPAPPVDVVTASLIDALANKAKLDAMARKLTPIDPERYTQPTDPSRPDYEPSESSKKYWTRSLRVDLEFKDPLTSREEMKILAAALVRALAFSHDHERGAYNQLADMRAVLRRAVQDIQHRRGKTFRPD